MEYNNTQQLRHTPDNPLNPRPLDAGTPKMEGREKSVPDTNMATEVEAPRGCSVPLAVLKQGSEAPRGCSVPLAVLKQGSEANTKGSPAPTRPAIVRHTPPWNDLALLYAPPLLVAIRTGDVLGIKRILGRDRGQVNTTRFGGLTALHTSCHVHNLEALHLLLHYDAKVDALDAWGQTALHLAVSDEWHEGVAELLNHGSSPDTIATRPDPKAVPEDAMDVCTPPAKGLRAESPLHMAVRRGDLASISLLLAQRPDLCLRDGCHNTVLHLAAQMRNPNVMRLLLQEKLCEDLLGDNVLHAALQDECDPLQEPSLKELVLLLLNENIDINAVNLHGESPLFLASKLHCPTVVEALLTSGADPVVITRSCMSVLHAACQSGDAHTLGILLKTSRLHSIITKRDDNKLEPFNYAVSSSSIDCCELLLNNGDHLTRVDASGKSRCSLILERLPSATQLLRRVFDARIKLSNKPQHDPNFSVTFDYSVLLSPDAEGPQSSLMAEISTTRLEYLLKHPLLESFLYIKWQKVKPFFYFSVAAYFVFLQIHTLFILSKYGGFGEFGETIRTRRWNVRVFQYIHVVMFLLILIPDLMIMMANFKKYLRQWETYTKSIALWSAILVVFIHPSEPNGMVQDNIEMNMTCENSTELNCGLRRSAAISSFFGWVEFMMLLGRFPSLGAYVLMFSRVAKSITKFILAFSCLLIGFSISFMILLPNLTVFSNFPKSIVKILMMMIGEINYVEFEEKTKMPIMSSLFLVIFLFLVCILLANLLIGLAVNDIPDLQRKGKIKRLAKQASYLVSYERIMRELRCFPRQLRTLLSHHLKMRRVLTLLPSKESSNPHKVTVPKDTLEEAILLGRTKDKEDIYIDEEDFSRQFKSFKIKYDEDRHVLTRSFSQLADSSTTHNILKEQFDEMRRIMESQMQQLSLQLQQHNKTQIQQLFLQLQQNQISYSDA